MSGGVPPSSRAGKRRPSKGSQVRRAANLYERFTGHDPEGVGYVDVPAIPKVGVLVGDVDGILYTTVRDGRVEKYIHKFHANDKPMFVVSPDGRCLMLVGGNFRFTERGIVDRSDKSR